MSSPSGSRTREATPSSQKSGGRLFTDSEELRLLKTLGKLTKSTASSPQITIDLETFNRINSAFNSRFTHSQITYKLRSLRTKYHKQARTKSLIKTPHDQKLFKISRKLWGKQTKERGTRLEERQSSDKEQEKEENVGLVETERNGEQEQEREEVMNLEDYPVLLGEISKYLPLNLVWREALMSLGSGKLKEMDKKWRSIGIEEAKIVIKKTELVKEQTDLIMKVMGNSANEN